MDNKQRIAIVGIGGIFPGANNIQQFWENIVNARDLSREPPQGRWLLSLGDVYSPKPAPDKVYSQHACFVDDFATDLNGLAIEREYLDSLDPMYHLLLHAGSDAWRDGVTDNLDKDRVGIIIGNIALPTNASSGMTDDILLPFIEKQILGKTEPALKKTNCVNRYVAGLPAGLLARGLGLGGGSYTLDAACASSLYALKYAVDELLAQRADAMLAGGLSRPDPLYTQMGFSALTAISPTGHCSPFDSKANGLVVGEGSGMVLLKRLDDAVKAGDHIYATIAGIGLSNDIGGNLMSPDSEGQLRAMRTAYDQAGWQAADVELIECHGTGTPVGDVTEFNSLKTLWGKDTHHQAVIGSVKSNIGHLLTAAGAAGLIKVLLAIKHKTLPPTANFQTPAADLDIDNSPFRILSGAETWQLRDNKTARRAAVSAFGFGGINAHVLLEEWQQDSQPKVTSPLNAAARQQSGQGIAIIGMDACFGPWRSLIQFRERIFGRDNIEPWQPDNWWGVENTRHIKGYLIDKVNIPLGRFRIPPNELKEMLPQQLLMLQVAANAIDDAHINIEGNMIDTGVYVGIGLDLNTTNFHLRWKLLNETKRWEKELGLDLTEEQFRQWMTDLRDSVSPPLTANRTMGALGGIVASRVARAFNVGGPSFTLSNEESSGLRALEAGVRALQQGEINRAIVGAVDLAGDIRAVAGQGDTRPYSGTGCVRPFDKNADGTVMGEGAAAVILKRHDEAVRDGDRIYAVIKGIGDATGGKADQTIPDIDTYQTALNRTLTDAGISFDSISYIETHGSGHPAEDKMEARALAELLHKERRRIPVAVGSTKADIGHTGAAAGLASIVKTSLCLYHHIIPVLRHSTQPVELFDELKAGIHVPQTGQYWLRNRKEGNRRALVSAFSVDGNSMNAVLEENEQQDNAVISLPVRLPQEAIFSVEADEPAALIQRLDELTNFIKSEPVEDTHESARQWHQLHPSRPELKLAVSLLAKDPNELIELINKARHCVGQVQAITDDQIFYNPEPLGPDGKLAFVFPGSGNHYQGMGREIAYQWPRALNTLDQENEMLAGQFANNRFWSSGLRDPFDHKEVIFGQVWLGTMVSDVISDFDIKPDAVIGYSLGETAGLFATRTWTDRDEMLKRMHDSTLFTHDLAGPCHAAKKSWGVNKDIHWQSGVIDRPYAVVKDALQDRQHVYLLIINTPNECVIGGDRDAVQKLVNDLNCNFHPVEGVTTVHCEVALPVKKPYRDLHLFNTMPPEDVRFYSGILGDSYQVTTDSAADSIVGQALEYFDYASVINNAYEDGIRIFIEMGPGASCTRMIDQILDDRLHIARAICVNGQSEVANVLRLLAHLNSERIGLDLSSLYVKPEKTDAYTDQQKIAVPVGKKAFDIPALPIQGDGRRETVNEKENSLNHTPNTVHRFPHTDTVINRQSELTSAMIDQMSATEAAKAETQEAFLKVSNGITETLGQAISLQMSLLQSIPEGSADLSIIDTDNAARAPDPVPVSFNRTQCMEFATGSIGKMLGPQFAQVDSHPTRVRLPDEPLMLVDRIIEVEGEPCSMTAGRVVTEHDIDHDTWYLDCGRIPTCIAVEAGQADLFLSGYLGIDLQTKGLAMYRLLDAEVTFHGPLPRAGKTIHYNIHIDHFFRQGDTHLFRFYFDGTVDDQPLITMRNGCAGFFTEAELDAGQGIVQTALEKQAMTGKRPADWTDLVPMQRETFNDDQINALRDARLADCFGPAFTNLSLKDPVGLPAGRMTLVHRVLNLDPHGGRFGIGSITGEADIHPDDWFLTCHFVDDQVMPGTLMYECCLHTLRIYLLRMGWVSEADEIAYEPVPGITSKLKCRGQVIATTQKVQYEITLKEYGYRQEDGTPYVIADALMYADGKPIVQMSNMSLQLSGLTRERLHAIWQDRSAAVAPVEKKKPIFDHDSILAFAIGKPSEAFGEPYKVFDSERIIARLPGPPYQFLDRIVSIKHGEQWQLAAGTVIEAQYDIPADAWYFAESRQPFMPFSVLLEVALQPCGWLAAYLGSALTSDIDLSFRNLGGHATQYLLVTPGTGTLTTTVKITNVSRSGGMIIQHYDYEVCCQKGVVYKGNTYFGFFSKDALANQIGLRDAAPYQPTQIEIKRGNCFQYPDHAPYPKAMMSMVDEIDVFDPNGGPNGMGFIRGIANVDPDAWFFKAHFYQDPVWPGSLGLESFIQLLKITACHHWGKQIKDEDIQFESMGLNREHSWVYRGQIIPKDRRVIIEAVINEVNTDQKLIRADGFLTVDGRIIYQMNDFSIRLV